MPAEGTLWRDVVCPFCGLACDDLAVERQGDRLRVLEGGCPRGRAEFEREPRAAEPQIGGHSADLASAVAHTANILRGSRLPLFAGLATDLDGMRAVLQLADRIGGAVDHLGSEALFRNLAALRDNGWISTSLSEVRNRMDLLLVLGHRPDAAFPRFVDRCVRPPQTLFSDVPPDRPIIRIGPPAPDGAPEAGTSIQELPCAVDRLPEVAAALRSVAAGRSLPAVEVAGLPTARLQEVAARLREARYGVIAWAAADMDYPAAELTIHNLSAMVQDLNRTTRCVLLPLSGGDNLTGVNQVCLWQSGYPLRTGFGRGVPEHDPYRFSADRLIDTAEADALVWISAFRAVAPPPSPGMSIIVIGPPETELSGAPDVFIPVGTPGLDHAGQITRMDGIVALRLSAPRQAPLPSVADVISRIDQALAVRAAG